MALYKTNTIKKRFLNMNLKKVLIRKEKKLKEIIKDCFYLYRKINPKHSHLLHEPTYNHQEIFESAKTLISTNVTMGKKVKLFENLYSKFQSTKFSLMCNSGSSANLLLISSLCSKNFKNGLKPGDEVIVPALSWSTTVWPIIQNGLIPVFVDCEINTLNIDLKKLEKSISIKTKAIFIVHVYGNSCNMREICRIAKEKKLLIIEDCCESMGAKYNKKPVGSFGIGSSFSLYFSHHITSIEGGICSTNNFNFIENLRIQRAHGWSRETSKKDFYEKKFSHLDPRFIFVDLGYNLRPTEMQADFAIIQLKKFKKIMNKRIRNYNLFFKNLKIYINDKIFIQTKEKNSTPSWFGLAFRLNKQKYPNLDVKKLVYFLKKRSIETRPIIAGNIANHPAIKNHKFIVRCDMKNSNEIMKNGLALGLHQGMTKKDITYISKSIACFLNKYS
jgi:CDP-6-deoxy-D-xylo-4-hexulose-3-dehydrase